MIPLSHQVNNKPLLIALGIAFVLHFFFTLTYHIDFEWTAPKPGVLNISITDAPAKIALIEPEVIKPQPADKETPKPSTPSDVAKAEQEISTSDYLASKQWVIVKKATKAESLQKIFIDLPPVATQQALSLYMFVPGGPMDSAVTSCTDGLKNYVFINCPNDSLKVASIGEVGATKTLFLAMPTSRELQYGLSSPSYPRWYNEVDRPNEDWTQLAGLPTISVPIY